MAGVCLPIEQAKKFVKALKDGVIEPAKLADMTSQERTSFFEKIVGEDAKDVNALFESKLLLKNQQAGLIRWAKQVSGITEPARRDIISKIERMDKILTPENEASFLQALAEKKLGLEVTFEEAQQITKMSKDLREKRTPAKDNIEKRGGEFKYDLKKETPAEREARYKYAETLVDYTDYLKSLKPESKRMSFKEFISSPIKNIGGTFKSLVSTLDNSFWGNQGITTLWDIKTTDIWVKDFLKSFKDIGKTIAGGDAYRAIKIEAAARPGAISGRYAREKLSIDLNSEEAFPVDLSGEIPALGRLFKASADAYNGAALRLRIDISDRLAKAAERNGVDVLESKGAEARGHLVNSSTGRGSLGKAEPLAPEINVLLYSGKLAKGAFDTLTAHLFDSKVGLDLRTLKFKDPFAAKQSAYKLLRMAGTVQGTLMLINSLNPGSAEADPRKPHWGQVKLGNTWFNIVGTYRPMVRMAARILPTYHDGKLGFWEQNKKGKWEDLSNGGFVTHTPVDVIEEFFENKASPLASTILNHWRGRDFNGEKPTLGKDVVGLTAPISVQNFIEGKSNAQTEDLIFRTFLDALGFNSTPNKKK